jgi:hypothetical protein
MASSLLRWVKQHPKLSIVATMPLAVIGIATIGASWILGRRKIPIKFDADGVTRPLSELDTWYSAKNNAHVLPHFYIAVSLTGKPWTLQEAQIVLSRTMVRHPPTMCTIVDHDDPSQVPYWRRLWHPSYAPEDQGIMDIQFETRATDAENDETWKAVARDHEAAVFSISLPNHTLIRLVIVSRPSCPYFEIIFIPHHAVCDARGASFFVRSLLEEWALFKAEDATNPQPIDLTRVSVDGIELNLPQETETVVQSSRWPTELEASVHTTPDVWFLLKAICQQKLGIFRPEAKAWLGPVDRGTIMRPTAEISWLRVPAVTVEALKAVCRTHGATINGALWASVVFALLRVYRRNLEAKKEAQTGAGDLDGSNAYFSLVSPVDMRGTLNIPNSVFSPMVVGSEFEVMASGEADFWNLALEASAKIRAAVPIATITNGTVRWMPRPTVPWLFEREARAPNGRRHTLEISNLGMLPFEDRYGELQLRDVWFSRHTVRDGLLFNLTVVTPGPNRSMNIGITTTKELVLPGDTEILQSSVLEVLQHASTLTSSQTFSYNTLYAPQS